MAETSRIEKIYRYPVKGLSPEELSTVTLTPGNPLPHDRRYAIENGPSGFDITAPEHLPKFKFIMLMRNERLASLRTHVDESTETLIIERGRERIEASLGTPEGRAAIEAWFNAFMPDELRGPPRVLTVDDFSFSDTPRRVVSIINLASVQDLENRIGAPVDPLRFRGNLHVSGWGAWDEFELVGREFETQSGVKLRGVKRIQRCAATNVDPATGIRDLTIPKDLVSLYGHADCGLYAEVTEGGVVRQGDSLRI